MFPAPEIRLLDFEDKGSIFFVFITRAELSTAEHLASLIDIAENSPFVGGKEKVEQTYIWANLLTQEYSDSFNVETATSVLNLVEVELKEELPELCRVVFVLAASEHYRMVDTLSIDDLMVYIEKMPFQDFVPLKALTNQLSFSGVTHSVVTTDQDRPPLQGVVGILHATIDVEQDVGFYQNKSLPTERISGLYNHLLQKAVENYKEKPDRKAS